MTFSMGVGQGHATPMRYILLGCYTEGLCRFLSSRRLAFFSKFVIFSRSFLPVQFIIEETGHNGVVSKVTKKANMAAPTYSNSACTVMPSTEAAKSQIMGANIATKKAQIIMMFAIVLIMKMLIRIDTAATPAAICFPSAGGQRRQHHEHVEAAARDRL